MNSRKNPNRIKKDLPLTKVGFLTTKFQKILFCSVFSLLDTGKGIKRNESVLWLKFTVIALWYRCISP